MAKIKIVASEKIKGVNLKKISKAVESVLGQKSKFSVELVYMSEEEIKETNSAQRNIDSVTDVLSFPTLDGVRNKVILPSDFPMDCIGGRIFLGSIAICKKRAAEQGAEYGHSTEREITYLIIHGLLHLFNYDHMIEDDKKEMRSLEKKVIAALKMEEV